MNISQLLNNGSIVDTAAGADPLPVPPPPCTGPLAQRLSTRVLLAGVIILAAFNWVLGQEVANEVDSLCKAGWPRRELIPRFRPASDHKGPPGPLSHRYSGSEMPSGLLRRGC